MSYWAAATPKNWTTSRRESSAGIIATRFCVELAYGKSIRERGGSNGRSFRKENRILCSSTFSDTAKRIGQIGRNQMTNARSRNGGKKKCTKSAHFLRDSKSVRT